MIDVLTYGTMKMMEELPQVPGETDQAYMAFLAWVKAGAPESAKELSEAACISLKAIKRYRDQNSWATRLEASSYGLQVARVNSRVEELIEQYTGGADLSSSILSLIKRQVTKLLIADTTSEAPVMNPSELAGLLRAVHEYERLEAGKSTENVAVAEQPKPQLEGLSVEELRVLKQALPNAFSKGEPDASED